MLECWCDCWSVVRSRGSNIHQPVLQAQRAMEMEHVMRMEAVIATATSLATHATIAKKTSLDPTAQSVCLSNMNDDIFFLLIYFTLDCNASSTCSNKGLCKSDGTCLCKGNFVGDPCNQCLDGYFGPFCDTSMHIGLIFVNYLLICN